MGNIGVEVNALCYHISERQTMKFHKYQKKFGKNLCEGKKEPHTVQNIGKMVVEVIALCDHSFECQTRMILYIPKKIW